ncbi:MAG: cold shock CspA family protein [Halieaceae bacterium]|jgi:cold shock CspA family protein
MSIPGKVLVAVLAALAVSALSGTLLDYFSFQILIGPTAVAAVLAVLLSHKALPVPAGLSGNIGQPSAKGSEKSSGKRPVSSKQGGRNRANEKSAEKAAGGNTRGRGSRSASDDSAPAKQAKRDATPAGPVEDGTVKWFNGTKGFGFIIRDNGEEIFVHHRSIQGEGRSTLQDGAPVRFRVVTTDKGPQAEDVEAVS